MKHPLKFCTLILATLTVTGCNSITGSWKKVSTQPRGAPFPIDKIIFDPQQNYTSTWTYEGQTHTDTGQYRYSGNTLKVMQSFNQPRTYKAKLKMDGSLVLTYQVGDTKVSATLIKEKKNH